jgi:RND family efflux transporter MFP subunit
MSNQSISEANKQLPRRILICVGVLAVGVIAMVALAGMKQPPAEVKTEERAIRVTAVEAAFEQVPVVITGYGEVRSLDVVAIAPEVAGRVVQVHPRLEVGEVIPGGELLFRVDPTDYQAAFLDAEATVAQLENAVMRLKKQYAVDRQRLKTIQRNRDLARAEFERLQRLYRDDAVGTRSGVEASEQAFNRAVDQVDQLVQSLEIYPIRIREAESNLASARARLDAAQANLQRCDVKAPFTGRVKEVDLEQGEYVTAGRRVVTLADDSVLEIQVPLDSRDVRSWLRFDEQRAAGDTAWFNRLEPVAVTIRWTEDSRGHTWQGTLHRVVKFDQQTRTLTVAVRIAAEEALSRDRARLPLVEGMFCAVEIPGRMLENVVRLPQWAVTFEDTVYIAENQRLKTVPVEVARIQGGEAFVSGGVAEGDLVVTTRLVDPLENALLQVESLSDKGRTS